MDSIQDVFKKLCTLLPGVIAGYGQLESEDGFRAESRIHEAQAPETVNQESGRSKKTQTERDLNDGERALHLGKNASSGCACAGASQQIFALSASLHRRKEARNKRCGSTN